MFCPQCGNRLEDDALFCGKCGAQLGTGGAAPKGAKVPAAISPSTSISSTATGIGTGSAVADMLKAHGKLIVGGVVALVVVVATIVGVVSMLTGGATLGQTTDTVRRAFEAQQPYLAEVPSSEYTNDSPYSIASFEVTDMKVQRGDWLTAQIKTAIENESFRVDLTYSLDYYPYPDTAYRSPDQTGDYVFNLMSRSVTPKKGVERDDANGVGGEGLELNEETGTCQTTVDKTYQFWFADAVSSKTITYAVGEHGWYVEDENTTRRVTYKDLDGEYRAKTGDLTKFAQFTLSGLNAETGTFTITYKVNGWTEEGGWGHPDSYSEASGTLTAAIEPSTSDYGGQSDGYSYYFEAQGDSDHGSRQASLSGYLIQSDDGSKAIEINSVSIGQDEIDGRNGEVSPIVFSGTGIIYKQ
ncbi:zinc ribbon domain-containing protein [Adlercreutzia caecimuris]|uniref:zinc ribbon domain-containing protein n=1 Tax=Adlercreutzia caecimuris TaxID=671266 RepID=UPI0024952032|nr:zinc ribbon domain-containing protein [Adlercreutzia caecimuris]